MIVFGIKRPLTWVDKRVLRSLSLFLANGGVYRADWRNCSQIVWNIIKYSPISLIQTFSPKPIQSIAISGVPFKKVNYTRRRDWVSRKSGISNKSMKMIVGHFNIPIVEGVDLSGTPNIAMWTIGMWATAETMRPSQRHAHSNKSKQWKEWRKCYSANLMHSGTVLQAIRGQNGELFSQFRVVSFFCFLPELDFTYDFSCFIIQSLPFYL